MKKLAVILLAASLAACDSPQPSEFDSQETSVRALPIDANELVGADYQDVVTWFGEPKCNLESVGNACDFGDGLQILFVNNRGANLTLPAVDDLYDYGIIVGSPEFSNQFVTRWQTSVGDLPAEVSDFGDYIYVKTTKW